MAYSTGSGDYTALMNAVVTHAVADGWVETGGVGTGWPLSKGNIRGVDYFEQENSQIDYTLGEAHNHTERFIRMALGTTPAEATTNATTSASIFCNTEFPIAEWHIFSDPSVGDHINVTFRVTTGNYSDVWTHFSFGELDRRGITTGHVAYVACQRAHGYARENLAFGDFDTYDEKSWLSPSEHRWMFGGAVGNKQNEKSGFQFLLDSTDLPVAIGSDWPVADIVYGFGANVLAANQHMTAIADITETAAYQNAKALHQAFLGFSVQPFSGNLSMAAMPIYLTNGSGSENLSVWVGQAPNIRMCSCKDYNAGDEITYGGDTWVIFPVLRKTDNSAIGELGTVTSGSAAYAYKKVV